MVKVRPLIGEYCAEVEAQRITLREQVAAEAARVDVISSTIYHAPGGA